MVEFTEENFDDAVKSMPGKPFKMNDTTIGTIRSVRVEEDDKGKKAFVFIDSPYQKLIGAVEILAMIWKRNPI